MKKGYVYILLSKLDKCLINIEIIFEGKKVLIFCIEKFIYFLVDMFYDFIIDEIEIFWRLL